MKSSTIESLIVSIFVLALIILLTVDTISNYFLWGREVSNYDWNLKQIVNHNRALLRGGYFDKVFS